MEEVKDDVIKNIKSVAEYELTSKDQNESVDENLKEKLKSASNFYMIPRKSESKFNVGSKEFSKEVDFYTVTDSEGYSLYTIIGDNITLSTGLRQEIERYLQESYPDEIKNGTLSVYEIEEDFTPHNMDDLFERTGNDYPLSMRYLSARIDEIAKSKGIETKTVGTKQVDLREYDNLVEQNEVGLREDPENKLQEDEGETLEETDGKLGEVKSDDGLKLDEKEEKDENFETYIQKIAKFNHVKPCVVNTRVIENFEKVEEDTGIALKGKYQRGDVVAVRIPYKLGYKTFLAQKSTGLTIDGKGRLDGKVRKNV